MTLLIRQIISIIQLLHSDNGHSQLAWGLTFGMFLGFSPFLSIQTLLILFFVFIFRIQWGTAVLSAFFFKFIAFLIDPLADPLGRWILESTTLRPLWTQMYNMPLVPYTRFNNSIVMGSFAVALLLSPFVFLGFRALIIKYRSTIAAGFEQTKLWKSFKATKFYDWYRKYQNLYGAQ